MAQKKRLMRSKSDRKFLGVCAGLGQYFGIDPLLVRLLFAVATIGGLGSAIPIYIILAFVMPEGDPEYHDTFEDTFSSDDDFEESARTLGEDVVDAVRSATDKAAGVAEDVIVSGRTAFGSAAHTLADAIDPNDGKRAKDAAGAVADGASDLGDDVSQSVKRAVDRATDGT